VACGFVDTRSRLDKIREAFTYEILCFRGAHRATLSVCYSARARMTAERAMTTL